MKVTALAEAEDWSELEKFSNNKISAKFGGEQFIDVCLSHNNKYESSTINESGGNNTENDKNKKRNCFYRALPNWRHGVIRLLTNLVGFGRHHRRCHQYHLHFWAKVRFLLLVL